MTRRYRCVHEGLFISLSGGPARKRRCQRDAVAMVSVTWSTGMHESRRMCQSHADRWTVQSTITSVMSVALQGG